MSPDPAPAPAFARAEYRTRLRATRAALDERHIDTLVVTDPANMAWLTGYDGWSFYSHQAVVVPPSGDPHWWGRALDVKGAERTTWLPHEHVRGFPEDLVQSPPRHPHQHLAELLEDLGAADGTVGVEMDAHYYTASAHHALTASLPSTRFTDATGLVNRCRAVKSPAELELMRAAGRIVERMHARILEVIEPGLPKHELAAEVLRTATLGSDGHWGDYPAIAPLMPSGSDGEAPHLTWDDRPFRLGEATFFEIAGCVRRYHAPASRSVHLGPPPLRLRALERVIAAAFEAGIDSARAGSQASDVAAAVFGAMEEGGIRRAGRIGYPVGLGYPPDWGERTMSLRLGDAAVLAAGMTFHLMPVVWDAEAALGITETIVVRPDGPAESLVDWPRRLFIKG